MYFITTRNNREIYSARFQVFTAIKM